MTYVHFSQRITGEKGFYCQNLLDPLFRTLLEE